jgi:hypothetical protein
VEELKRRVEQREQEASEAAAALALARARLAIAEGKAQLAAREWRKVLVHSESRLKVVKDLYAQGRICFAESLPEAQGAVAVARARLADAEGRRGELLAGLPKVIAYHEWRIEKYQTLLRHRAIAEKDAQEAVSESAVELRWARERLAALRGKAPGTQGKTGGGDRP